MLVRRLSAAVLSLVVVALYATPTSAETRPNCAWEVDYDLAGNLKISDTPMGQADGIHRIGPGKAVLRFDNERVSMVRYTMHDRITVEAGALFWWAKVTAETYTTAAGAPDECSVIAEGVMDASRTLRWRTPIRGYRADGTLTCTGSVCGKFGAPAPGRSELHIAPQQQWFKPFVFAPDMQTFTMASTHVTKTKMPKQSTEIALAGREVRRTCVPVAPCGQAGRWTP